MSPVRRPRAVPATIPVDSALAQLGRRLAIIPAIGAPDRNGPSVLPLILEALGADGWSPPPSNQAEGGRLSGEHRRGVQIIRRIAVGVILDNAPRDYRDHPRSQLTLEWVREQLAELSSVFGELFTDSTLAKDIEDWAYHPDAGRKSKNRLRRVSRVPGRRGQSIRPSN